MGKKKIFEFKTPTFPLRVDSSKLNLFLDCHLKYLFRQYSNVSAKDTTWPGTIFGSTVHKINERALVDINNKKAIEKIIADHALTFEQLFFKYKERAIKSFKESRYYDEAQFIKDGVNFSRALIRFLTNYFDTEKIRIINPELKFIHRYDFVDDVVCVGKIDMLAHYNDGSYEILDLKTTSKNEQYYFVDWTYAVQDLMYEFLALKTYTEQATAFKYVVLNRNEKMIFVKQKPIIAPQTYEEAEKYFQPLTQIIQNLKKYLSLPLQKQIKYKCDDANICRWCEYKKQCATIGETHGNKTSID